MPANLEPVLTLLLVAVLANLVVMGFVIIPPMIGIRCEADRLMSVAEQVGAFPEVSYVVITAGSYDILIETVCEDNDGLLRFLAERLRTIDGVRETETFVYLRLIKQSYQWGTR